MAQVDKIFGALTGSSQKQAVQPLGPAMAIPHFAGVPVSAQSISGSKMNPYGQISPNVTTATTAVKLPNLYA